MHLKAWLFGIKLQKPALRSGQTSARPTEPEVEWILKIKSKYVKVRQAKHNTG